MPDSQSELDPERELTTIPRSRDLYRRSLLESSSSQAFLVAASVIIPLIVALLTVPALLKLPGIATHRDTLSLLIRGSWAVIVFAVAVGVASAGTIQIGKQVFGVRGFFQRIWMMQWIGSRSAIKPLWEDWRERKLEQVSSETRDSSATELAAALRGLTAVELAAAQRGLAATELEKALLGGLSVREFQRVFDLPVEQLCAQVGAAADVAMSQPQDYAELLLALTGPTGLKGIDLLAPAIGIENGRIVRTRSEDSTAYAQVAQAVSAGVDIMQISLGQRWQRGVRRSAVIISGLLGVIGALLLHVSFTAQILFVVAALVLGGFFAWLIRDLVAIVERVRR